MPPIAAAIGAIGSAIAGGASAAVATAGTAIGGLMSAGGTALGGLTSAGGAALGGLTSAGGAVVSGATGIFNLLSEKKTDVLNIAKAGSEIYGMFQRPEQQTAVVQPVKSQKSQPSVLPTNILNTLPQIIQKPQQQILTTPATKAEPQSNKFIQYLPIIGGIALIGYLLLRR